MLYCAEDDQADAEGDKLDKGVPVVRCVEGGVKAGFYVGKGHEGSLPVLLLGTGARSQARASSQTSGEFNDM